MYSMCSSNDMMIINIHRNYCAMDDLHNYYTSEFLNTLTPNELPPHV